jgi:large subunit ribosomal protein L23
MDLTRYDIIKRPIISDKAYKLSKQNKVLVQVHQNANSPEIKKAAEQLFGVKITKVNIIKRPGKRKRVAGRRSFMQGQAQKRALLTLAPGYSLEFFGHTVDAATQTSGKKYVSSDKE